MLFDYIADSEESTNLLIRQRTFRLSAIPLFRGRCGLRGLEPPAAHTHIAYAANLKSCGPDRDRTDDLLNANQALSQLSYRPLMSARALHSAREDLWARVELNYRPHAYQACALTT